MKFRAGTATPPLTLTDSPIKPPIDTTGKNISVNQRVGGFAETTSSIKWPFHRIYAPGMPFPQRHPRFPLPFLERFFRFLSTLSSRIYSLPIFTDSLCYQIYRVEEGGVSEGLRMWQNNGNRRGNSLPSLGRQFQIDNGDQQPTARAENVSGSRRLSGGVSLPSMTTAMAIALPQQTGFLNPVGAAVPVTSPVGLPISIDQGFRVFESGETSTSRLPQMVSTPYGYSLSQEIFSQIRDNNIEIATLVNNYSNTIRQGIEEKQKSYWISQLAIMEQMAMKQILEKHAEVENSNRRNSELEERISKLSADNQIVVKIAHQYKAYAFKLQTTLKNVLSQNTTAAAPPLAIEGCGDNGWIPLNANDEQSCYNFEEPTVESIERVPRRMICKLCLVNEISIVILPCLHLCLCKECESKVDICPICHSSRTGAVQIFIP